MFIHAGLVAPLGKKHLEDVSTPFIQMNFTVWLSFGIISVGKRTCFPEPATELQLAFHKVSFF